MKINNGKLHAPLTPQISSFNSLWNNVPQQKPCQHSKYLKIIQKKAKTP